tara:strand:- start:23785 stop:24813 length:1029 start_codon:yes stop_codon:yes gene_type:complete
MWNLLPYALAAYGGYQGYQGARQSGASGLGRLFGAGLGAYGGYTLGSMVPQVQASIGTAGGFVPFRQTGVASSLGMGNAATAGANIGRYGMNKTGEATFASDMIKARQNPTPQSGGSLLDLLFRRQKEGAAAGVMEIDPLKLALTTGAGMYASGAFKQGPTDIYTPGYNMGYLEMKEQRGNYKYIDPATGQEKEYEAVYAPEEAGKGQRQIGPYSYDVQRLRTGGIAEIKKFNEGGVNYLPSKISHDENDSTNYVRATGYVEDGSGTGDKDEDTMLAQLADGEFVTRADGVLGAGIIAGANPNSFKDMREKGAEYFYDQQKKYKRVFDLLKEKNGDSKQKAN